MFDHIATTLTYNEELQIVIGWLSRYPNHKSGSVPAIRPYLPHRDEAFAQSKFQVATQSKLVPYGHPWQYETGVWVGNLEHAQEAIYLGHRLGYRPECISAYLVRNYVPFVNEHVVHIVGRVPVTKEFELWLKANRPQRA